MKLSVAIFLTYFASTVYCVAQGIEIVDARFPVELVRSPSDGVLRVESGAPPKFQAQICVNNPNFPLETAFVILNSDDYLAEKCGTQFIESIGQVSVDIREPASDLHDELLSAARADLTRFGVRFSAHAISTETPRVLFFDLNIDHSQLLLQYQPSSSTAIIDTVSSFLASELNQYDEEYSLEDAISWISPKIEIFEAHYGVSISHFSTLVINNHFNGRFPGILDISMPNLTNRGEITSVNDAYFAEIDEYIGSKSAYFAYFDRFCVVSERYRNLLQAQPSISLTYLDANFLEENELVGGTRTQRFCSGYEQFKDRYQEVQRQLIAISAILASERVESFIDEYGTETFKVFDLADGSLERGDLADFVTNLLSEEGIEFETLTDQSVTITANNFASYLNLAYDIMRFDRGFEGMASIFDERVSPAKYVFISGPSSHRSSIEEGRQQIISRAIQLYMEEFWMTSCILPANLGSQLVPCRNVLTSTFSSETLRTNDIDPVSVTAELQMLVDDFASGTVDRRVALDSFQEVLEKVNSGRSVPTGQLQLQFARELLNDISNAEINANDYSQYWQQNLSPLALQHRFFFQKTGGTISFIEEPGSLVFSGQPIAVWQPIGEVELEFEFSPIASNAPHIGQVIQATLSTFNEQAEDYALEVLDLRRSDRGTVVVGRIRIPNSDWDFLPTTFLNTSACFEPADSQLIRSCNLIQRFISATEREFCLPEFSVCSDDN